MTLDEVATFIASACSLTVATNLFKGKMPDAPNACAAVYEYPGLPPIHVFGQASVAEEFPRVQIAFRGDPDDYATPRALAETAYKACAAAGAQLISGARFLGLDPLQPPFPISTDGKGRRTIGFNVQVGKELS